MSEKLGGGGAGSSLGHIHFAAAAMNKLAEQDHDLLKNLHLLFYKTPGTKLARKKDLRAFNGFPAGTDLGMIAAKIRDNKKWTVSMLKDALTMFNLEKGGDRETLIGRLVTFLNKPVAIKPPEKKKKSKPKVTPKVKGKKAKKVKKSDGPKRTMSSYMLFAKDQRAQVVKDNPGFAITEVASKIGELWRGLSDAEKGKYKAKAEKLKADAAKATPTA